MFPRTGATLTHRFMHNAPRLSVLLLATYFAVAYALVPAAWRRVAARRHPAVVDAPRVSRTKDGIPGDPLNIALIGTESAIARAMHAAGWYAADPITLRSSLRIAADSVLRRPDVTAPVSNLYVWNRMQDLAYEQPVGNDPRRRHHVRFWKSDRSDDAGRPFWIGAATFDARVGLSRRTGQITHHIDPDLDRERSKLLDDLQQARAILAVDWIVGFNPQTTGHNGGGDLWRTDGRLPIGVLAPLP